MICAVHPMALTAGSQLGPYEIQSALGAGGMGEVYKARDTRLDRTVAIKVLPPSWADNLELKQRFERDAKIIAGLNHPHICTLHDIGRERPRPAGAAGPGDAAGEAGGDAVPASADLTAPAAIAEEPEIDFLVLEHLEGETVADRLARAAGSSASKKAPPLRVDEALSIAMQIADALDKAHGRQVVHRDLKPSSVFLTRSGGPASSPVAKLLDFGLAPPEKSEAPASVSMLPTRENVTALGTIAGTLEYMAPEQLEGKDADARTDIFAFGVVLYEMLTGKKAFEGKSRAVLMAAIMTAEPDPLLVAQPAASPALDHVLKRCLAKDPDDRWQTAHDLLIQLRWITSLGAKAGPATARERNEGRLARLALAAAFVMAAAVAWPVSLYLRGPGEQEAFQLRLPVVGLNSADISVSPDGQTIAFLARPNQGGAASLFVRPVGSVTSRRLAGTDDAAQPFWSPDSRYIGFVAGGKLKKVEAVGGPPQEIAPAESFSGGTWNQAGTVLFGSAKGLFSVSAEGGKPAPVTTIEKGQTGHFWPYFLPDGRHYLYLAWSAETTGRAIFIGTLDSKDRTRLVVAESNVAYAPSTGSGQAAPGYLVFHREATVFAQPFDADTRTFTGDAIQLAGGVAHNPANGRGSFAASPDTLLYFQGDAGAGGRGATGRGQTVNPMQWGWVSRTGPSLALAGEAGPYGDMDLSPDGKLIAATRQETGAPGADIWVIDWERASVATPLTLDPADDINPVWSPDGRQIAFTTYRKGNADIYVKNANGVGAETPILESSSNESVEAWSSDGRYIAYLFGQDNFQDIYALPMFGEKKPFPLVQGHFQKNEPQFSHDGKWLAYTSDESGTFKVYVMSFPALDQKLTISTSEGGGQPRWRQDGKELFYRGLDDRVMVADIKAGATIEAGIPRVLFDPGGNAAFARDPVRHLLAVSPDGQRFLLRVLADAVAVAGRAGAGTPQAGTVFDRTTGQVGGVNNLNFNVGGGGGGRGFAGGEAGFTVIRNWKATAEKGQRAKGKG